MLLILSLLALPLSAGFILYCDGEGALLQSMKDFIIKLKPFIF